MLIQADEKRRRELEAEISALTQRQRVIGATQDASWITRSFIEPRVSELRLIVSRITLVAEKVSRLRDEWQRPVANVAPASADQNRWFDTGSPAVICLAA